MNRLASLVVVLLLICGVVNASDERSLAVRKKSALPAERRIALVIGNSSYADAPLKNPVNDADAMAIALREAGFDVIMRKNADRRALYNSIKEFGQKLKRSDVGLFYYAGHGVQVENANYLLPVDLRGGDLQDTDDLRRDAIPLGELLERMRDAGTNNIIVLDACRDNPFLAKLSRSGSRGLAKVVTPASTSVLYSTDPGNTASDGASGDNGVFTRRLVDAIQKDGMELVDVMREVSVAVNRDTNGVQRPVFDGVLSSKFYFHPAEPRSQQAAEPAPSITVDPKALELRYWESAEKANTPSAYKSYLKKYPGGDFADLANEKLLVLENAKIRGEEAVKAETERKAQEAAERERLARERAEQDRRMRELEAKWSEGAAKAEAERKAQEVAERERLARERAEQERRMRELEAKFLQ
ncbi:MAG TPA: caspase family protein, partial [Desulfuromonadaceae bacterium]